MQFRDVEVGRVRRSVTPSRSAGVRRKGIDQVNGMWDVRAKDRSCSVSGWSSLVGRMFEDGDGAGQPPRELPEVSGVLQLCAERL